MILTQREKYIAIILAASVAVLVGSWALVNYVTSRRETATEITQKRLEMQKLEVTLNENARLRKEFKQMVADGLKNSQSEAKGQIREALDQWAPASGVSEKTLNDGQVTHESDFDQISFRLSGWGTQANVVRLLNYCETTTLPLRVTKITLIPVKEARDYVSFELTVSTICQTEKDKSNRTRASAAGVALSGARL